MAEDKLGSCKVEPYNGLTLRQLLRMEIAMYYTIQKIESQIKILKAREAVKAQNESSIQMIKKKELELKEKLNIKQN